jgi:hypothetical protein
MSARATVTNPVPSPVCGRGLGRGQALRDAMFAHAFSRKAYPLPDSLRQTGAGTGNGAGEPGPVVGDLDLHETGGAPDRNQRAEIGRLFQSLVRDEMTGDDGRRWRQPPQGVLDSGHLAAIAAADPAPAQLTRPRVRSHKNARVSVHRRIG